MSDDLHGEAGVSMRDLETETDEAAIGIGDEESGSADTPAARWHGISAAPATDPLATDDDENPAPPRAIRRYLLPDEDDIIAVQLSRALLLAPGAAALGGLVLAVAVNGWLYAIGKAAPGPVYTAWLLWAFALGWAAYRWIEWRQTWFVVTGHRIFLRQATRIIGVGVTQLPIDKMRDLRLEQTVPGRILGYGTLDFASIGTEKALDVVNFLPWPEWLYQEINKLKMPDTERKAMRVRAPGRGSR